MLSYTDDVPLEAIFKELSRHESRNQQAIIMELSLTNHAAQLVIPKQLRRQELRSSAGNCQADDRQESCSSAGNCQADEQTGITQFSRP